MHNTESRFVIGPSDILFAGVYVCTFQPGKFTGWGSRGVRNTQREVGGGGGRKGPREREREKEEERTQREKNKI